MKDVVLLVFEHQCDELCEEFGLLDFGKYLLTGDGYAVTQHFQQFVLIQSHGGGFEDFLQGSGEVGFELIDHGL